MTAQSSSGTQLVQLVATLEILGGGIGALLTVMSESSGPSDRMIFLVGICICGHILLVVDRLGQRPSAAETEDETRTAV